jgi:hypothetical protein
LDSRFRHALAIITYIDRVCISQAAPTFNALSSEQGGDGMGIRCIRLGIRAF